MPRRDSSDSSSDRSSGYKRRSKKRKRRSSSSSSEDSIKRHHHRSSRSTSSSRSRSRERSRRRRSRSHSVSREHSRRHRSSHSSSRERLYKRRSHSSSRERSRKHRSRSHSRKHGSRHSSRSSRHRIRSRSKNKKSRSSSRSDSHSRGSKKSSRKSRSRSHSPHRQKSNSQGSKMREDDVIKLKLQQALKAAATADAELREKGLLAEQTTQKAVNNNCTPSVADQVKRAQIIEEINAPTFTQQPFTSGTSVKQEKSVDGTGDIHTAAMFGSSTFSVSSSNDTSTCINNTTATTKAMREIWKNNPEKLAHENLFEDVAIKTERWKKKLLALRRKKMNGEHMM